MKWDTSLESRAEAPDILTARISKAVETRPGLDVLEQDRQFVNIYSNSSNQGVDTIDTIP